MKTKNVQCSFCGNVFMKLAKEVRRQLKHGHGNFFCSSSCLANSRKAPLLTKYCLRCGIPFIVEGNKTRKHKSFCSLHCAMVRNLGSESRKKLGDSMRKKWIEDPDFRNRCLGGIMNSVPRRKMFTSKGETDIRQWFKETYPEQGWTHGGQLRHNGLRISRDLYSNKLKVCIEYDGIWHFKDINSQLCQKQAKDAALEDWCMENGWKLIRIRDEIYQQDKHGWRIRLSCDVRAEEPKVIKHY